MARMKYPGLVNPTPFGFAVSLTTDYGGSASVNGHFGSIDFFVDNCSGSLCDITINDVMLLYDEYEGSFSNPAGPPLDFEVEGVHLRLLEPVLGVVNSGTVSFPSDAFHVTLSTGDVILGSTFFTSIDDVVFIVDQVSGTYSAGVLTLNIDYSTVDADVSVTITAG